MRGGRVHIPCASCIRPSYASCIRPCALVPLQTIKISQKMRAMCSSHQPSHALTLLLSLSPHLIQPAPCPQEITQGSCDVRMPYSSAASCFRGDGLVHQQQGSVSIGQQVRARCLPRAGRLRPVFDIMLSGSSPNEPHRFLRVCSVDLEAKR